MNAAPPIEHPISVTVITLEQVDYGAGKTDRVVFQGCKYRVDDHGTLNVYQSEQGVGNVATFAPGQWASVIRGRVVSLGTGYPAGKHELKAVQS